VRHDGCVTEANAHGAGESADAAAIPQDLPDDAESEQDAARRRFREALDRKRFGHHGQNVSADPKARAPHASPAKPQRTFRRKSG
jgi:hypothetical protein